MSKPFALKTFEQYLHAEIEEGKIDFRIRAQKNANGHVEFYIHPLDKNGDTRDYEVAGDTVYPKLMLGGNDNANH